MTKVITAMGNPELNNELKKIKDISVMEKDIIYIEGIIEYLEENKDVDIVVLSESLCGEKMIEILKIITNENIKVYLLLTNFSNYYKEDFDLIENVKTFGSYDEILLEFNGIKVEKDFNQNSQFKNNKRIISILGSNGVGKTVLTSMIGKQLAKNSKVLIIDFDIFNNSIKYLFNIKNNIKNFEIENLIQKIDKNLYVLIGVKYIFNERNKIDIYKVKELLNNLKREYEYILIDTSCELTLKYIKTIIPNCDFNIFIIEANKLEIKKASDLLETYKYDFGLNIDKTGVILNKINFDSIDAGIMKEVFKDIKILGRINYNSKFNAYVNTYTKEIIKLQAIIQIQKMLEKNKNEKIKQKR